MKQIKIVENDNINMELLKKVLKPFEYEIVSCSNAFDSISREKTHKSQDYFLELLAHNLKTPIRAEKTALNLLLDGAFGELTEEQKEIVEEVLNSSLFMLNMTDNLLTKYKLDKNEFKLNKKCYSIEKCLQECLNSMQYQFKSKKQKVKINSQITNINDYLFEFDYNAMQKVLMNMILNASEHSPMLSEIVVELKKYDENIVLNITDNGKGFSKEILQNFSENKKTHESKFKKVGTGQGLLISKKIIELHNGSLKIKNNFNGAICSIILKKNHSAKLFSPHHNINNF